MVERQPISELVSRQQKLSDRLEKKGNLFGGAIPAKIAELDPWTQTDKLLKLGRAGAWLERSILEVQQSLESNSKEINIRKDELLGKAQTYQAELEQRRTQLAKMEELSTIPATSIAGFKVRLAQFESQKDEDPELKLGFQFLQEQETKRPTPPSPPAAPVETPPAEPEPSVTSEIVVDKSNWQITIGKKGQIIEDNVMKAVLTLLSNRKEGVHNKEVAEVALAAGSTKAVPAGDAIRDLRKIIEEDPSKPSILVTIGHTNNSKYLLNLPVRFTEPSNGGKDLPEITLNKEGSRTITVNGTEIKLTAAEMALTNILYEKNGEKIALSELRQQMKHAGFDSDPSRLVWGIEQKTGRIFDRGTKVDKIGLWSLPRKVEEKTTAEKTEISEEENIRREALLAVINYAGLTEQERKVFATGVVYSNQNLGSNIDWARRIYGEEETVNQVVARLDVMRRRGLKKLAGKIELVSLRSKNAAGYFLKLVEVKAPPKTPAKPEFGAEPVDTGYKDYSGRSLKFPRKIPDGQEIEIQGYITATAFDLIINSTKDKPIPTEKISHNTATRLREILKPDYEIILIIDGTGRKSGQKGAYYLEKIKTQIPPEQQEEIAQLEQSLASLLTSRPTIAEAASLGLPGNHAADLEQLDILVTQKQERLRQLGQG